MKKEVSQVKKVSVKKTDPSDPHTEEIKRYIGAVTENFQHQVSAIAEQFLGLNEKLDAHTEILYSHTEMLNTHTEMIGHLMVDMEDVKIGLQQKVSRDEFNKLESRLVSLEAIVLSGRATGAHTSKSK